MATKRKAAAMMSGNDESVDPADELMFLCLGGGNEVGRSCHIIQYKGKTIMVRRLSSICIVSVRQILILYIIKLDAGQHPAYDGLAALPFFDDFDLSTVDVLLISQ